MEHSIKELKGFARTHLEPGGTKSVAFILSSDQLTYYCEDRSAWIAEPGDYKILVGPSSRPEDLDEAYLKIV